VNHAVMSDVKFMKRFKIATGFKRLIVVLMDVLKDATKA